MRRLGYFSTVNGAPLDDVEFQGLVIKSAKNNLREKITGVLAYNGRNFLQILEGEAEAIGRLYDKITRDERHAGVCSVIDEPIDERTYSLWGMVAGDRIAVQHPEYAFVLREQIGRMMLNAASADHREIVASFMSLA